MAEKAKSHPSRVPTSRKNGEKWGTPFSIWFGGPNGRLATSLIWLAHRKEGL
jgi:hypothetical protein